jgi:hypothetical protein
MGREFGFEQSDKLRVHELKIVWDAESHEGFTADLFPEVFVQPVGMLALHTEDQVSPAEVAGCDLDPGAVLRAGTARLVARMVLEE